MFHLLAPYLQRYRRRKAVRLFEEFQARQGLSNIGAALDFIIPKLDYAYLDTLSLATRQDTVFEVTASSHMGELMRGIRMGGHQMHQGEELRIVPVGEYPRLVSLDDYLIYESRPVRLGRCLKAICPAGIELSSDLESMEAFKPSVESGYYRRYLNGYLVDLVTLTSQAYSLQLAQEAEDD